jgi:prolyl oligopeptidase
MRFNLPGAPALLSSFAAILLTISIFQPLPMRAQDTQTQSTSAQGTTEQQDKYLWLEDVRGERAMQWVKEHNEASAKIIESDPHYAELEAAALKVLESPERLALPDFHDGVIYNTWQDAQHVKGILRRTSLDDYLTPNPHWETVLDYDALAEKDKQPWVHTGINCLFPGNEYCMVGLSAGGEDAQTWREFNLKTSSFVDGGFALPRGKQDVTWIDKDTLLIAREWGPGTMTKSGYAFIEKIWKRGQPLESAKEVYRGTENDMTVGSTELEDAEGNSAVIITRMVNFFEGEYSLLQPDNSVQKIGLAPKSEIEGLLHGQLIVTLNQEWTPEGSTRAYAQGSVVAIDLAAIRKDPIHLKPTIVFEPNGQEFEQQVAPTRNHLIITTLDHVQGRAYIYTLRDGVWARSKLSIPDNLSVSILSTDAEKDDRFFLGTTGFLTPSSLLLGDAATQSLSKAKSLPPQFDASKDMVEQLYATSKDGTKVPYFVVRPKAMKFDGNNPTLLTAYGGFQVSMTPYYSALVGKLWLEHGGVYVLANIRGGGEFGPAWHEAGLKTHRQRIYDDFAAVGKDLVTRKITRPQKLGIMGGSNGGLLMGVEMTQHPDMWKAIVIQVPLLDMLRFEHIAAGASWVGEYGSVSVPEQRAFLASISPYNQLKASVQYPTPYIFTTTKDDRVGPVHARKFAAKMEEYGKPFFYDEIVEGGHAAGANLKEDASTWARQYTYLMRELMN